MSSKYITNLEVREENIRNYLRTPEDQRIPLKEFLRKNHLMARTFYITQGKVEAKDEIAELRNTLTTKVRSIIGDSVDTRSLDQKESDDLAEAIKRMDEAVYKAATIENIAKMAELWYKRKGLLIEKQEVDIKVGLSADEIARRNLEAERELREIESGGEG